MMLLHGLVSLFNFVTLSIFLPSDLAVPLRPMVPHIPTKNINTDGDKDEMIDVTDDREVYRVLSTVSQEAAEAVDVQVRVG